MPYNRIHVRAFLGAAEISLFESSLGDHITTLGAADLKRRIERTRKLRDKSRDLLRRQKIASRARTGSKGGSSGSANERTAKKAKALDEALKRFEAQHKRVEAAANKPARAAKNKVAAKRPRRRAAAVVLRDALQKKHAAEAVHNAALHPGRSAKAPAEHGDAQPGGLAQTPPEVRAAVVSSRLHQANLAQIQGHSSAQVRKTQSKRDRRGA